MGGEQRRKELIALAYSIIAEKGFEGLRVRDVASRAGINGATLHYYFPTKEAMVQAVVEHLTEQFSTLREQNSELTDPLAMLRQEFADVTYRMEKFPELFIVAAELELRSLRDSSIAVILKEMYQAWQDYLAALLQNGVTQKVFRSDLDVQTTAIAITTLIRGLGSQLGSEKGDQISRIATQVEQWIMA
ncbi:hypothetical protein KSF_103150 [Reticulibacter mediterranei]|uniref:HTH tetR-type domain-containing protein n=2 Tax=Reticulibacter mediterranei TaxID=2778369 RepID=A0A8J3N6D7_9CHLR|nr:hypothetical protein KSF_103150 [Reticulibacter mediterranei]